MCAWAKMPVKKVPLRGRREGAGQGGQQRAACPLRQREGVAHDARESVAGENVERVVDTHRRLEAGRQVRAEGREEA